MSAQNRELVLRHHDEVWTKGNFDAVDEIYAPDFVGHHPGKPDWVGAAGVKLMVQNVRAAFPDFRETVEDVVAADDKVVTRFTAAGTHLGILRGIAPTGKAFRMAEIGIFRILNGRIAEKWGMIDRLGMFQQLGIVPAAWPPMEFLYEITMDVTAHDVGLTPSGRRRIVQVTGGTFDGPRLRGRVLPGGGDWLLERPDGSRRLDVRITLETHDSHLIYATYGGLFCGPAAVTERLARGETVHETEYYFRTAPLFETASEKYDWLNRVLALGIGRRSSGRVAYSVYAIA